MIFFLQTYSWKSSDLPRAPSCTADDDVHKHRGTGSSHRRACAPCVCLRRLFGASAASPPHLALCLAPSSSSLLPLRIRLEGVVVVAEASILFLPLHRTHRNLPLPSRQPSQPLVSTQSWIVQMHTHIHPVCKGYQLAPLCTAVLVSCHYNILLRTSKSSIRGSSS
jgi:hypothetical protein